jgi:hypothetical protein
MHTVKDWSIAVHNITLRKCRQSMMLTLGCGSFSTFSTSWSLLPSQVVFGKALFPCFAFPVVVPYPPSIDNHSASELAKHGLGGDDGDLARSVRIGKNFLIYQVILLRLGSNDLEK